MTGRDPKREVLPGREAGNHRGNDGAGHDGEPSGAPPRHRSQSTFHLAAAGRANQGALTATQAEEEVVPASAYKALFDQVRELQPLLGKKSMEAEILKEALEAATGSKKRLLRSLPTPNPRGGSR